jgi:hypothetical protein
MPTHFPQIARFSRPPLPCPPLKGRKNCECLRPKERKSIGVLSPQGEAEGEKITGSPQGGNKVLPLQEGSRGGWGDERSRDKYLKN